MINLLTALYTIVSILFLNILYTEKDVIEKNTIEDKLHVTKRIMSFGVIYSLLSIIESLLSIYVLILISIPLVLITISLMVYVMLIISEDSTE